jgi:hypothetical protein
MSSREPLALRGTPRSLSALVSAGTETLTLPVEVHGEARFLPQQLWATYRSRAGGVGEIRVALPHKTPPGKYEATVVLPDGEQRMILEVEAQPRLQFHPRGGVVVSGNAKETVTATVTALNEGNGGIEIPQTGGAGMYVEDAAECAIGRTLRAGVRKGEDIIDRVAEEFATDFGGTMRVNVTSGAGILEPDSVRDLTLALRCPEGLAPGKTYAGQWTFSGGALTITVRTSSTRKGTKA